VVVAASHDRVFLQSVCGTIVDLDPAHLGTDGAGGDRFTGGYDQYLQAKRDARRRWQEAFERHQDELDTLREAARSSARQVAHGRAARDNDKFIHAFKGGNVARAVSRRVADVRQRIEVLERHPVPRPPEPLRFRGLGGPAHAVTGRAVEVRDLTVSHRLHVPRLDLEGRERLLVTGTNGSGKSTLLKVLAGRVAATSGVVEVRARRVGHLPQDVTFRHPDRSALAVYEAATGSPVPLRDLGLLHARDIGRPVGDLSVGQQRRLGLAVLVARAADLLLLDEPTNHISLALADELEDALSHPPAAVVVASHDRWLRRRWTGRSLALEPVSPCGR
jgi:macrolide transport system ATP-binding/permease protein